MSDMDSNVDCHAILNHVKLRGRGMGIGSFVVDTTIPAYQKALRIADIQGDKVLLFKIDGFEGTDEVKNVIESYRPATQFEIFLAEWKYEFEHTANWGRNNYDVYLESALYKLMKKYSSDISTLALDDYFHKAFRQTDVVQEPGIDGVIWNLLQQVKAFWVVFERFKVDNS